MEYFLGSGLELLPASLVLRYAKIPMFSGYKDSLVDYSLQFFASIPHIA